MTKSDASTSAVATWPDRIGTASGAPGADPDALDGVMVYDPGGALIGRIALPVPLVADKLTQSRLSEAVQAQSLREAVIVTVVLPPEAPKLPLAGEIL